MEEKNQEVGKNMGLVIDFFNKFSSFSLLSCYPNSGKDLIYLFFPFSSVQTKQSAKEKRKKSKLKL